MSLDLSHARIVTGVGRNLLEQRIAQLCDEVDRLQLELAQVAGERHLAHDNLTATQQRCSELLNEARRLRVEFGSPDPRRPDLFVGGRVRAAGGTRLGTAIRYERGAGRPWHVVWDYPGFGERDACMSGQLESVDIPTSK